VSWKDGRILALRSAAESAAAEMRAAAQLLRSKADSVRSRTRNGKQITRDLRLQADRLDAAALSLVAEASTRVPITARLSAKLGLAVLLSLQALAGGAGQQLVADVLSDHDNTTLEHYCATAALQLDTVVAMADDLEADPANRARERLIDAVLPLSQWLDSPHGFDRIEEASDEELVAGAIRLADAVQSEVEARAEAAAQSGVESDVAWAYSEIRYLTTRLFVGASDEE
jgi:hypothetical protein